MTDTLTPPTTALPQERRLVTEIPGPRSRELMDRRVAAVSAGVGGTMPVFIERAGGGVIIDVDGNSLIDLGSGIAVTTVGNANPHVVQRVQQQVADFTHTCFIVKIARAYTKRQAVVVFDHGYHGRTNLTMALTAKNMPYKQGFGPFAPEVYRMPMSYPFRDGPNTGPEVAAWAASKMDKEIGGANIAAIVIEPIQGEGGFIVPAPGFLQALRDYATLHGIVFVADEIQTGFCRTGQWFACEDEGIVPDLITTAKGIAGGLPLAAVTGRADIMDAVHVGGLGGTYSGNPVACAAALGSIEAMEEGDLTSRAQAIGDILLTRLREMASRIPAIGDVRGRGAMVAMELVQPGTLVPDPDLTGRVAKACHLAGVVVLTCGTYGNVIRLLPPLTIPDALLNEGLDVLEQALTS